jgi:hypothetical protein
MSEANIRAQIKTILESVSGIGIVHNYQRYANDWNTILSLFRPTGKGVINGWMISRSNTPERIITLGQVDRAHSFLIRGFYSHDDVSASEIIFQALLDSVQAAFRKNLDLNGSCDNTSPEFGEGSGMSGLQIKTIDLRMFGSVLCHYCELTIGAVELADY